MRWTIKIVADTNDADYVTALETISDEDLNKLRPLITAIKNLKPYPYHNWPDSEYAPREDLGEKGLRELYPDIDEAVIEKFRDLIPRTEPTYGVHTINSIEITPEPTWEKLL